MKIETYQIYSLNVKKWFQYRINISYKSLKAVQIATVRVATACISAEHTAFIFAS